MSKNTLLKRKIIFAVIILFIGTSVTPAIIGDTGVNTSFFITCESVKTTSSINKGSLSGYVNDTLMNPIKGTLVRVYFHETYEEDYTDYTGYYHITNIPICYCLKNTTATKLGYKTEWSLLAIEENTTYDFVLTHSKEYNGSLSGYVNDTSMNPIEGSLVRVYFHGTYEDDYTDSLGYYHVTTIPICYCLKNCTASKEGYKTEWTLLGIIEDTTYDFVLKSINDGTLSGYVNNTSMNPIEGALVRVYFHEAYEEDYTDASGYYHVTNIPICYCLKNCTASKEGYKTEWALLGIIEDTTYDFVLKSSDMSSKWVVTDNPIKSNLINNIQKDSGIKTLFMKADCNKILLYKRFLWPVHMGPFWFTSNFSYLCFFIEKDFILRIDGVDQEIELPIMVVPWRFIGLGPLHWVRNIVDPCNGNVTLMGICQEVVIEPYTRQ